MDGVKVYELTEQKICPGSYSFTWDGTVNVVPPPPPPDGLAPAGLYVFDIEVIGIAPGYDEDTLRSRALRIGEHEVVPVSKYMVEAKYVLYSGRNASDAWIDVWELVNLSHVTGPIHGPTHAIPENTFPQESDYNVVQFSVSTEVSTIYAFLFWARDDYPDIDKFHRRKIALVNQRDRWKGWFLGIGFDYSQVAKEEVTRLIGGYMAQLDTSDLPGFVAGLVGTIYRRDQNTNRLRMEWGWTPQTPLGYHIHTYDYSPSEFAQEVNTLYYELYSKPPHRPRRIEGIIYFTGHGGYGRLIGFATGDPSMAKPRIQTFGAPRSQGLQEGPEPDVPYTQLTSLLHIRLIYLSACRTCVNESGTGLVAALANMVDRNGNKIGPKAVVGYHITLKAYGEPPSRRADPIFWGKLTGKIVEQDEKGNWTISRDPEGAGNVEQAVTAAAKQLARRWRRWLVKWKTYMGIAGRNGQQDALGTTLY